LPGRRPPTGCAGTGSPRAAVERAPSLVTGGYKIDVRASALDVLRRMGVHDAVVDASTRRRDVERRRPGP
jgi:hypothetical protein